MKINILSTLLSLVLVFTASSVFAIGRPDNLPQRPNTGATVTGKPAVMPSKAKNRLTEAKLKACQAREDAIKKRIDNLSKLVTKMEETFDAIAGRVQDYYTKVVIPSGKTVANYDVLVANIATSKATIQTGLDKAYSDVADFSCDSDDPKAKIATYRLDMQGVIQELKEYRTSIKNLIVAVRSVTGTIERTNPTVSPKPAE